MTQLPKINTNDIARWYKVQAQLAKIKSEEAMLRARIFEGIFTDPHEGVNNFELNDGTGAVLKGTYVVNRSVDIGELEAFDKAMRQPDTNLPKLNLRKLVEWKPSLVIKEYRALTDEERRAFDHCLVIKPGSPQMKVEIPKRASRS